DPAAIAPVAKFAVAHLQFASQVSQPPFVWPEQFVVTALVADQATAFQQLVDHRLVERAGTLRRAEAFLVERSGDLLGVMPGVARSSSVRRGGDSRRKRS